jgi:hypothetical protein
MVLVATDRAVKAAPRAGLRPGLDRPPVSRRWHYLTRRPAGPLRTEQGGKPPKEAARSADEPLDRTKFHR